MDAEIKAFPKSLGIPRATMPQIRSAHVDAFFAWLDAKGHRTRCVKRQVGDLKPTQKEVNLDKAQEMLSTRSRASLKRRIVISRDDYILDGHHRWAALRIEDPRHVIEACKVNLKIRPLLRHARKFKDVGFAPIAGPRTRTRRARSRAREAALAPETAPMSRTGQWVVVLGILAAAALGATAVARAQS